MASSALLRRRKYIVQFQSEQVNTIQRLSSIERQGKLGYENIRGLDCGKSDFKDEKLLSFRKNKELFTSLKGFQSPNFRNGVERLQLGHRLVRQSMWSSVATANKPDHDKKEEKLSSQSKEASPEECDEAVEGLSLAKAKAKAMKLEESQKSDISILQHVWSFLLGIGPALRAIASMSDLMAFIYFAGKIGPRSFVTGKMNLNLPCNTTGLGQSLPMGKVSLGEKDSNSLERLPTFLD